MLIYNKESIVYSQKEEKGMKRVIVAVQNSLVSEAVLNALQNRGMFAEKSLRGEPQSIASLCESFFADVLIADVTRFGEGTFDNRAETVNAVRKNNPEIKVCFICDNTSDGELSVRVAASKEMGFIDAFFYQSVPSDYIADVISTM